MLTITGFHQNIIKPDFSIIDISVIIPVLNDPLGLKDTLDSLVSQDYPADRYEIIIADNGSDKETRDVINEFQIKYPKLIRLVIEDKIRSSYAARNKGIENSMGSVLSFIDADMSVDKDWLTMINKSSQTNLWNYLACRVDIYCKKYTVYAKYDQITGFPIESYIHDTHFAPTCCLVVRKSVFDSLGLFDSRLVSSGDLEFGNRVYLAGHKLQYNPKIALRHPARSSFRELYQKTFRVGQGLFRLYSYYPKRYEKLHRDLLNPLYYFPDVPWKFIRFMRADVTWKPLPFWEKVTMYYLNWILRVVKKLVYLREIVK
jgi:glycosyltransferase involved in cell wall biosynthesis